MRRKKKEANVFEILKLKSKPKPHPNECIISVSTSTFHKVLQVINNVLLHFSSLIITRKFHSFISQTHNVYILYCLFSNTFPSTKITSNLLCILFYQSCIRGLRVGLIQVRENLISKPIKIYRLIWIEFHISYDKVQTESN